MKVTVCQLNDDLDLFAQDWETLGTHLKTEGSELVLLPEMPFCPWLAWTTPNELTAKDMWNYAVALHQQWQTRLQELAPTTVIGSCPVNLTGKRLNQGFIWNETSGYQITHTKYYLPDEPGFWEASWYQRGNGEFIAVQTPKANIGFAICTELWFTEHARGYAKQNVHLLVTPRATEKATLDRWRVGGQAAAIMSGAFSLSSNKVTTITTKQPKVIMGGQGWIIDPDGQLLGLTSAAQPMLTLDIDLKQAEEAKQTYPRYVFE